MMIIMMMMTIMMMMMYIIFLSITVYTFQRFQGEHQSNGKCQNHRIHNYQFCDLDNQSSRIHFNIL